MAGFGCSPRTKAAKITPQAHYYWLQTDRAYGVAFRESQTIAADPLNILNPPARVPIIAR